MFVVVEAGGGAPWRAPPYPSAKVRNFAKCRRFGGVLFCFVIFFGLVSRGLFLVEEVFGRDVGDVAAHGGVALEVFQSVVVHESHVSFAERCGEGLPTGWRV